MAAGCQVKNPDIAGDYSGGCKNGLAYGQGTAKGKDEYTGQFLKGLPHGKGIYNFSTGNRYEGDWKNGVVHGYGILDYPDGVRYEGGWQSGIIGGKGVMTYADGSHYEGEFKRNFHGIGKLTIPKSAYKESKYSSKGEWIGDFYALKGIFESDYDGITTFVVACSSEAACKKVQQERVAEKKREEADEKRRQAYANSSEGRAERRHQQMCEAQKATCVASCPFDRVYTTQPDMACASRCNGVSCY